MIKRSFVWLLTAYCIGILCKDRHNAVLVSVFIIYTLFAVTLVYKPVVRRLVMKGNRTIILIPLFFLLGMLLASYQGRDYAIDGLLANTATGKAEGYVYGRISAISRANGGYKIEIRDTELQIDGITFGEGRVMLWSELADGLKIGNRIAAFGTARQLTVAENPGQFDEKEYYRAKNVACRFNVDNYVIYDDHVNYPAEIIRKIREKLSDNCERLFPEEEAGLVKSILLGDKGDLLEDTRELYQNNGIGHILAISGLHVSLLGYGLYDLLRKMKLTILPASLITVVFLVLYGMLTGFGVSTIRAVVSLVMAFVARLLGRKSDSGQISALTGLVILLVYPLEFYRVSFRLSFAAALGISAFSNEFSKWRKGGRTGICAKLSESLLAGVSPQIVTTPIILYTYYEIPVYSFLINLIILPCLSFLVVLSGIALIIAGVSMKLAALPAGGAYWILRLYKGLCNFFLSLPSPMFLYGNPGRTGLILSYAIVTVFFVLAGVLGRISEKKAKPGLRKAAALVFLLLPLIFIRGKADGVRITSLSVGQGDCTVIQTSNKSAIIIDCGSSSVSSIYKYRLKPFLKYSGISTIEALILTHPDADHINGVTDLLQNAGTGKYYAGNVSVRRLVMTRAAYESEKMADIVKLAKKKKIEIELFSAGDVLNAGKLVLTCLSPFPDNDTADNDGSFVFLASMGDFDGLFMGDSGAVGEEAVFAAERAGMIKLPVEILKVSHHGSKSATSEEFVRLLQPSVAVLSYGRGNSYGHPHAEVVKRLEEAEAALYMTGRSGAAQFFVHE